MAWQPFCCKIIATQLAAINSKKRLALLDEGELIIISNVPLHGCGCTREKSLLVGMQTDVRSTCLFRERGWQHLACSQWSHQCPMVDKYRQVQPSAGWGALWWIPDMSNLGTTTLSSAARGPWLGWQLMPAVCSGQEHPGEALQPKWGSEADAVSVFPVWLSPSESCAGRG